MGKVVITKEQADEIKRLLQRGETRKSIVLIKVYDWFHKSLIVNSMDLDLLICALYIGYEVEPEFKSGDWVFNKKSKRIAKISLFGVDEAGARVDDFESDTVYQVDEIRHATQEEIEQEKERRWWKKHGRKPWEIREDDVLKYLGDLYIVDWFDSENVSFDEGPMEYMESFNYVKENFRVLCFAEKRLD